MGESALIFYAVGIPTLAVFGFFLLIFLVLEPMNQSVHFTGNSTHVKVSGVISYDIFMPRSCFFDLGGSRYDIVPCKYNIGDNVTVYQLTNGEWANQH